MFTIAEFVRSKLKEILKNKYQQELNYYILYIVLFHMIVITSIIIEFKIKKSGSHFHTGGLALKYLFTVN